MWMTRRLCSPLSGWAREVRRWLEMVEGWRSEGGDGSMMVDAGDGAVARLRWMDVVGGGAWWRAVVLVVMEEHARGDRAPQEERRIGVKVASDTTSSGKRGGCSLVKIAR